MSGWRRSRGQKWKWRARRGGGPWGPLRRDARSLLAFPRHLPPTLPYKRLALSGGAPTPGQSTCLPGILETSRPEVSIISSVVSFFFFFFATGFRGCLLQPFLGFLFSGRLCKPSCLPGGRHAAGAGTCGWQGVRRGGLMWPQWSDTLGGRVAHWAGFFTLSLTTRVTQKRGAEADDGPPPPRLG